MRMGENALFLLRHASLVARVSRSANRLPTVQRELDVAQWLAASDFPAARPRMSLQQPIVANGLPITFWELEAELTERPASADELGSVLKRFHALPPPPFPLPSFDPLSAVPQRLHAARSDDLVQADEIAVLTERYDRLSADLSRMQTHLPLGLIHGDAHTSNILLTATGPKLIDFEVVAFGPREWDLVPASVSVQHFGLPEEWYQAFAHAYGWDVRDWQGYALLRDVREITMTTWLMQNVRSSDKVLGEFRLRVESIREGDHERRWHAY
jgi:aminoglycoside phosphotransferase (APT) family kinase protein